MTTTDAALEVRDLFKRFGDKEAVAGLSFSVRRGEILALLGPNGAGKTTTIEMCEGFIKPSAGSIRVLSLDPTTQPDAVRARVGIMLQGGGSYTGIKVGEMLRLSASYNDNPLDPEWLLDLVGLRGVEKTTYRRLSGGQKQRLSLALALISRPELVFLDEPTAGMDAQSRLLTWKLIERLRADGVTVVLTTHLMDEAEALADHVVIVDHGKLVAEGTPEQLRSSGEGFTAVDTAQPLDVVAINAAGLDLREIRPLSYSLYGAPSPDAISVLAAAAKEQGVLITALNTRTRSLEEVFLEITGRNLRS